MTYYVRITVSLKLGEIPAYSAMMAALRPFMARHGWVLVFGLQPFVGDLSELVHIWEVQRFEDIERALQACFTEPEAQAILTPMPSILNKETMQIMVKTSYSP